MKCESSYWRERVREGDRPNKWDGGEEGPRGFDSSEATGLFHMGTRKQQQHSLLSLSPSPLGSGAATSRDLCDLKLHLPAV